MSTAISRSSGTAGLVRSALSIASFSPRSLSRASRAPEKISVAGDRVTARFWRSQKAILRG